MTAKHSAFNVRSLITLGISVILYLFIFVAVVHFLAFFLPPLFPLFPAILALLEGFVFLLLVKKAPRFGIITLFSVIISLFLLFFGHGTYTLAGIILGFLADLILRQGHYQSWKYIVAGYMVFSLWTLTALLQLYLSFHSFQNNAMFARAGSAFITLLQEAIARWNLGLLILLTLIGAYLGIYWGRSLLRKVAVF